MVTPAETPVPVRLMVCVAGLALSVMVTAPVLVPVVVGLKVTLRVQLARAATLEPQVLVWEKLPLALMLVIVRPALPVVLECDALSAAAGVQLLCREGQGSGGEAHHGRSPVPVRLMVCVAGLALSVMVTAPVLVPRRSA